ncbi:MAG: hypothetical protein ACHP84_17695 [Caulobacterales bacterium]
MTQSQKLAEVEKNYSAFQRQLPELMVTHAGKFAVLRHAKIVDFFDTLSDAARYAARVYPDGMFSVQEVTGHVVNLGFYSHAVRQPTV